MKHLFLDTNVIIDVLANRLPFSGPAAKLLDLGDKNKVSLYISALSFSNIYYILRKECSHKQLIAHLRDLEAISTIMEVSANIIHEALNSGIKDLEDAIQLYTALSNKKIKAIITSGPKGFRNTGLSILTPDETLRIIENIDK
jgi:predicted nucleic acid-binding protein